MKVRPSKWPLRDQQGQRDTEVKMTSQSIATEMRHRPIGDEQHSPVWRNVIPIPAHAVSDFLPSTFVICEGGYQLISAIFLFFIREPSYTGDERR